MSLWNAHILKLQLSDLYLDSIWHIYVNNLLYLWRIAEPLASKQEEATGKITTWWGMTLRAARCSLIKVWFISFRITGAAVVCVLLSEACRSPQSDRRFSACGLSPPMIDSVKFILKTRVCADSLWCENGLLLLFEHSLVSTSSINRITNVFRDRAPGFVSEKEERAPEMWTVLNILRCNVWCL